MRSFFDMGSTVKGNNFLLEWQILAFQSSSLLKGETEIVKLSSATIPIHLNIVYLRCLVVAGLLHFKLYTEKNN